MKKYYYINSENNVCGPIDFDNIKKLFETKVITSETLICEEGKEEWIKFYEIKNNENENTNLSENEQNKMICSFDKSNRNLSMSMMQGYVMIALLVLILLVSIFQKSNTTKKIDNDTKIEMIGITAKSSSANNVVLPPDDHIVIPADIDEATKRAKSSKSTEDWQRVETLANTYSNSGRLV
jgi:hypothetical protein